VVPVRLTHHSIVAPEAAWGHAVLTLTLVDRGPGSGRCAPPLPLRAGGGATCISASVSCAASAATTTATSATRGDHRREHASYRVNQHHKSSPRTSVVAAASVISYCAAAPSFGADDDATNDDANDQSGANTDDARAAAQGGDGTPEPGNPRPGNPRTADGLDNPENAVNSNAREPSSRGKRGDDDAVGCSALNADACPVSPEFHDARVPAWVSQTRARWDGVTARMASSATVPFLFLTLPQIVKNASLIAAGRPDALGAISWEGQVTGLLGNLLLLSYFADKGEMSAWVVQGVGVCATGALLTQICMAGHIPLAEFSTGAAAVLGGVVLSVHPTP